MQQIKLALEDGSSYEGFSFASDRSVAGEVVFNTGMVGYPESLTDPSYHGQILTLTYPLIGNYGIPENGFESSRIQVTGLIISDYSKAYSHWNAVKSLSDWLKGYNIPALYGIDTRALTKRLRKQGTMLGKIVFNEDLDFFDPNKTNLVEDVSIKSPIIFEKGKKRIVVIDCGCKNSIIKSLLNRNITVIKVPYDYNFFNEDFDGLLISNGPGDPKMCKQTILNVRKALQKEIPTFGICLGNQILALAAGADTYKLKFGHRSQNQPCINTETEKCFITSQNHGYAVKTIPKGWEEWFRNANDGTNEGIKHKIKPFFSVQFHPEAMPGPVDTGFLFDEFIEVI